MPRGSTIRTETYLSLNKEWITRHYMLTGPTSERSFTTKGLFGLVMCALPALGKRLTDEGDLAYKEAVDAMLEMGNFFKEDGEQ